MNIKDYDIGPIRWRLSVWSDDYLEMKHFTHWIKNNYPDCKYKREPRLHAKNCYEIRGTDVGILVHIKLIWG